MKRRYVFCWFCSNVGKPTGFDYPWPYQGATEYGGGGVNWNLRLDYLYTTYSVLTATASHPRGKEIGQLTLGRSSESSFSIARGAATKNMMALERSR